MFSHSTKRQREQEDPAAYNEDLVREKKKHRPLPLRSPARASQLSNVQNFSQHSQSALTPAESSEDEDVFAARFRSEWSSMKPSQLALHPSTPILYPNPSMDMDISEDQRSPDEDGSSLLPAGLDGHSQHLLSASHSVIRESLDTGHLATLRVTSQPHTAPATTMGNPQSSPVPPSELSRGSVWWRSPRLPSPVSENGDAATYANRTFGDTDMVYDIFPPETTTSSNPAATEAEAADVRKRLSSLDLPEQGNAEAERKPVRKLGFSMGYRADCEKCRRRVPGHYSHIIKG
ncbi:hypothetical protein BJX61DRAFT_539859 [Aspergillus egyptiacus]|nr:hypothetical protein BJX61DRAFT_539859 [Aspergillus egyptiacus]